MHLTQDHKILRVFQHKPTYQNVQTNSKSNVEQILEGILQQSMNNKEYESRILDMNSKIEQLMAHNKILESQIAQQATTSNQKVQGRLPSQP